MNLAELTTRLQTLCHEEHSLDEVVIDGKVVTDINIKKQEKTILISFEKEENA